MKFCGKFKGCVKQTIVNEKGVNETEFKAVVNIKSVNCSNKTAYLITIIDQNNSSTESNVLAFEENFEKPILRSITEDGLGITSTYFDDKRLIHQVSSVNDNCKNKVWTVKTYKLKKI